MRRMVLPAALVLACLGHPLPALADADPPSDVLIGFDYYVPFKRPDDAHEKQLRALMKAARADHHLMKAVIIADRSDLGAIPGFFGKPAQYADVLDKEVRTFFRLRDTDPTLVIVMQKGIVLKGGPDATPAARAALEKIDIPANASGNELTSVAVQAVRAVAEANGHPLPDVPLAGARPGGRGGSSSAAVVIIATLGLVTLGAVGGLLVLRRPPPDEDS
jgi:hypothetical protein